MTTHDNDNSFTKSVLNTELYGFELITDAEHEKRKKLINYDHILSGVGPKKRTAADAEFQEACDSWMVDECVRLFGTKRRAYVVTLRERAMRLRDIAPSTVKRPILKLLRLFDVAYGVGIIRISLGEDFFHPWNVSIRLIVDGVDKLTLEDVCQRHRWDYSGVKAGAVENVTNVRTQLAAALKHESIPPGRDYEELRAALTIHLEGYSPQSFYLMHNVRRRKGTLERRETADSARSRAFTPSLKLIE